MEQLLGNSPPVFRSFSGERRGFSDEITEYIAAISTGCYKKGYHLPIGCDTVKRTTAIVEFYPTPRKKYSFISACGGSASGARFVLAEKVKYYL